jgi:hypothetical protein
MVCSLPILPCAVTDELLLMQVLVMDSHSYRIVGSCCDMSTLVERGFVGTASTRITVLLYIFAPAPYSVLAINSGVCS